MRWPVAVSIAGWLATWLATASGCAGSGVGLDANGQPIGGGAAAPPPLTADFQSIQDNVFTPICTRCHIGAGAPQGLQLDAAHSYALLVGVPSSEESGVLRVKPGDPAHSYLILKLEGASGIVGGQMPFGGPYLPQSTIEVIRQWITDGAMPSTAASAAAAPASAEARRPMTGLTRLAVIATYPAEGAVIAGSVTRIVVGFNAQPDQSLVNATTVELAQLAAPSARAPIVDAPRPAVPISIGFAAGNPATMLLTPVVPLSAGTYRIRLRGSGGAALADLSGNPMGRNESFTFTVRGSP
jgi:Bacterial Ig-like domain